MRVFVTGVNGQLGHDCMAELSKRGYEAIGSDIQDSCNAGGEAGYVQLDITDHEAVLKTISGIHPDVIIHCDTRSTPPEPATLRRQRAL